MTLEDASRILAASGTRLMGPEPVVGIWSDLDCEAIRLALFSFGNGGCLVRYLDGPGIEPRFKVRRVPGDPVPMNVLEAMLQDTRTCAAPWHLRDRLLARMN